MCRHETSNSRRTWRAWKATWSKPLARSASLARSADTPIRAGSPTKDRFASRCRPLRRRGDPPKSSQPTMQSRGCKALSANSTPRWPRNGLTSPGPPGGIYARRRVHPTPRASHDLHSLLRHSPPDRSRPFATESLPANSRSSRTAADRPRSIAVRGAGDLRGPARPRRRRSYPRVLPGRRTVTPQTARLWRTEIAWPVFLTAGSS